jgi:Putative transposase
VFTLPHTLNPLAQGNPRVLYGLLFQTAAATLQTFGRDPKWLGGELGITMVLHTWSQTLEYHLHVHCVVTGGALAPDESRWIPTKRRDFLFPVKALARVFRGKYLTALQSAYAQDRLQFTGATAPLWDTPTFQRFLAPLWQREHSVILTLLVVSADSAQTPDPKCHYTWHSAALTFGCCWPHTTKPLSA